VSDKTSPHGFRRFRRFFNRSRCAACLLHEDEHPVRFWAPARAIGDKRLPLNIDRGVAVTGRVAELLEQADTYAATRVGTGPVLVRDLAARLRLAENVVEAARSYITEIDGPDGVADDDDIRTALAAFDEGSAAETERE
jgi:hypothetical protein